MLTTIESIPKKWENLRDQPRRSLTRCWGERGAPRTNLFSLEGKERRGAIQNKSVHLVFALGRVIAPRMLAVAESIGNLGAAAGLERVAFQPLDASVESDRMSLRNRGL